MNKIDDLNTLVRLLKEFEFPVSPILEFAIKEKYEALGNGAMPSERLSDIANNSETNTSKNIYIREKKKPSSIRVIKSDGSIIECTTAGLTLCEVIKEIGAKKVYDMKLPMDGMFLVTIGGNPQYPTAQHNIEDDYFVNVHSNNKTKKRQLEKIFTLLNLSWKVEIINNSRNDETN